MIRGYVCRGNCQTCSCIDCPRSGHYHRNYFRHEGPFRWHKEAAEIKEYFKYKKPDIQEFAQDFFAQHHTGIMVRYKQLSEIFGAENIIFETKFENNSVTTTFKIDNKGNE